MIKLALLLTAVVLAALPGRASGDIINFGHWPRTTLAQELRIPVVDEMGDPADHAALVTAIDEWNAWSPDIDFAIQDGACSTAWQLETITPGVVCMVPSDLSPYGWLGVTQYRYSDLVDSYFRLYLGVQIRIDTAQAVGLPPEGKTWLIAHELGHALGLAHAALPSVMFNFWAGQCCPTDRDLTDLHSLYDHVIAVPAPTVKSFSPTSGKVGTLVTVTGTNLTGVAVVRLNGLDVGLFTHVGSTKLTFKVPTGATTGKISADSATSTGTFKVKP